MELKPGYKQTEVGVIPEDWDVQPLLKAVHIANGQVNPKHEPYKSMILVAPDHIESSTGKLLSKETAADQGAISGKYMFGSGDILYSKIRPYLRKAILADFSGLCSADMYPLKPAPWASGGYILAVILGHRFTRYAESVSVRSGMPKINRAEMADFAIAVPPLLEQIAIGSVLSDVDRLIGELESLIAKKRNIKQATMQELLTGKRRLPGFEGEWEEAVLGDHAKFSKGKGLPKSDLTPSGPYGCIHYGELFTLYDEFISETRSYTSRLDGMVSSQANDVLIPTSDVTPYGLAKASCICREGIVIGGDILVIRPDPSKINGIFLSHLIRRDSKQILRLVTGTTVYHIYSGDMKRFAFRLPSIAEQAAIVEFFDDIRSELCTLQAKLEKAKAIKQGMMQQLLTGKIRLT